MGDLLKPFKGAVCIQEQDVYGASVHSTRVVPRCGDSQIHDSVAIDVAHVGDRRSKAVTEIGRQACRVRLPTDGRRRCRCSVGTKKLDEHLAFIAEQDSPTADRHIGNAVAVQVTQRSHGDAEPRTFVQVHGIHQLVLDLSHAVQPRSTASRIGDRDGVVLDLAVRGGADRVGGGRVSTQPEPRVGRPREPRRHHRKHQCERLIIRTSWNEDLYPFSGVVEHPVGIEVDPAGQRGVRPGRVRCPQCHRRLRTHRQHQI